MNRMGAKAAAVLMAGLLLGATACGGSTKKEESSGTGQAVTATTAQSTATTASSSGSSSNSELNKLTDELNNLGGNAGDCVNAGLAFAALALAPLTFMSGGSQADISKLEADTEQLRASIPAAVQSDFDTYAAGIKAYAEAMQGVSLDNIADPSVQAKLEAASNKLDTPQMKTASDNIQAYFDATCPQ
jgi:hypothetical protein